MRRGLPIPQESVITKKGKGEGPIPEKSVPIVEESVIKIEKERVPIPEESVIDSRGIDRAECSDLHQPILEESIRNRWPRF